MFPATRTFKPLLLPLLSTAALFAIWWLLRPAALSGPIEPLGIHWERLRDPLLPQIYAGYTGSVGEAEASVARRMIGALAVLVVLGSAAALGLRRRVAADPRASWSVGVTLLALLLALGHLAAYLILPMRIGEWWHVYPREPAGALLFALGLLPALPRRAWLELPAAIAIGWVTARMGSLVAEQWRRFDHEAAGFAEVTRELPRAPKLLYMVLHHDGTNKKDSPFVHLPAWVQANNGGWLSFQFIGWGTSPIRYRQSSPSVPPPFGRDWEWAPRLFLQNAPWFDWFMIRSKTNPSIYFQRDPSIELVREAHGWWLFRRR
jgi:hypothetical protein